MGGLISGLLVREGGHKLWSQFSDTPPSGLGVSTDARQELEPLVNFAPCDDVERVIFVATRHRGIYLALRPIAWFFASLIRLPSKPGLPYHPIIGDRGRGDTPDSSDGVVPYWSSHLVGAVSETIVPSGHGANENPQGIAKMERILRESH